MMRFSFLTVPTVTACLLLAACSNPDSGDTNQAPSGSESASSSSAAAQSKAASAQRTEIPTAEGDASQLLAGMTMSNLVDKQSQEVARTALADAKRLHAQALHTQRSDIRGALQSSREAVAAAQTALQRAKDDSDEYRRQQQRQQTSSAAGNIITGMVLGQILGGGGRGFGGGFSGGGGSFGGGGGGFSGGGGGGGFRGGSF